MRQDSNIGNIPGYPFVPPPPGSDPDDEVSIDLRALAGKIWGGKWIILISMLIAGVLAFLVTSQMVPLYRSSAKVMFDLQSRNLVNVDQLVVSAAVNENTIQNEIEILTSTSLMERVIDTLNLDQNPSFNPALRPETLTIADRVSAYVTVPQAVTDFLTIFDVVEAPGPPPDEETLNHRLRQSMVNNLREGLSLKPIQGSKVIEISYTSENPQLSSQIVNAIAAQYIVDQLDAKLEATRTATSWLSDRVEELRVRLQTAEEAIQAAEAEMAAKAGQSLENTRKQLEALNGVLSVARNATTEAQDKYARLSSAVEDGVDLGALSEFRESRVMQSYREKESDLLAQERSLRVTFAPDHPSVLAVVSQLDEVRNNIRAEAERIVVSLKLDAEAAQARQASIEEQVRALEATASEQSREEIAVRQLEREAQSSRVLYEDFLARMKETSEQEELQAADARILSAAEPALYPLSQAKRRTLALGLILGAMSGLGIIFLLDKLNNTFRTPMEIEKLTGETVLGTVPEVGNIIRRKDIIRHFRENPKSSLAEALRQLRTSILFSNLDKPPKVVLFTSTVPSEGKSTTSMLIALTSQQMGKSAIIVDCDLRVPALARLLGVQDDKPGLLAALEGREKLENTLYVEPETGLHVLMTKPGEERSTINAADILSSNRFSMLLSDLKDRYDLVILDTPPTLVVADSRILSRLADAVVYAVRWDQTPRQAVIQGLKELEAVKAPIAGVVLTVVNEAKAARYTYNGYSYSRGHYKKYYSS